jgi:hypothetical protein
MEFIIHLFSAAKEKTMKLFIFLPPVVAKQKVISLVIIFQRNGYKMMFFEFALENALPG